MSDVMRYDGDALSGGEWIAMVAMMVLFTAVLVAVVVWAVRQSAAGAGRGRGTSRDRAGELLDERFARGDIDADEYRRRRDLLEEAAERRGVRS